MNDSKGEDCNFITKCTAHMYGYSVDHQIDVKADTSINTKYLVPYHNDNNIKLYHRKNKNKICRINNKKKTKNIYNNKIIKEEKRNNDIIKLKKENRDDIMVNREDNKLK